VAVTVTNENYIRLNSGNSCRHSVQSFCLCVS